MTRCDECQLVTRSDEGRLVGRGRVLRARRRQRARHPRHARAGRLAPQGARASSTAAAPARAARRSAPRRDGDDAARRPSRPLPLGAFDAAFVNGAVEHVDPSRCSASVRAALKPGGDLVVVVGDDSAIRGEPLPRYALSAVPLTRVTLAAGLPAPVVRHPVALDGQRRCTIPACRASACRCQRMAHLAESARQAHRGAERPARDARPRRGAAGAAQALHHHAGLQRGRARSRRRSSACTRAHVAGVDREIVIIESNSTDGSRELVQKIEHRPGVIVHLGGPPAGQGPRRARRHRGVDGRLRPHPGRRQRVRRRRLRHRARAAAHAVGHLRPRLAPHGRAHLEDPPVRQPALRSPT